MTRRIPSLVCGVMLILVFGLVPAFGQNDIENPDLFPGVWYRLLLDSNGDKIEGGGDGLGWHYYPQSNTWRMWFYNGPYSPDRTGYLYYHVYTKAVDPSVQTNIDASFGWTTGEWSRLNNGRPPLPDDMPTTDRESLYMSSWPIYTVNSFVPGTVETERGHTIYDCNPEWVCITLKGSNAYVYRGAFHECRGDDVGLGACCNHQTGYCYECFESNCLSPMVWLGAGSTCEQCSRAGTSSSMDFGDAPDRGYRTLLASDGARHTIVPGVFLGSRVDGELNGQPAAAATGDDAGEADEDGVTFTSTLSAGQSAAVEVVASTVGYLNAWIDFDGDGRFDDGDDCIFDDRLVMSGVNELVFSVPADAASGWTYARFRFSTRGLLDSYGLAEDGEVEDYYVQIVRSRSFSSVSGASCLTWSQPPTAVTSESSNVFHTGSVSSSLHLHEFAADDWEPVENQPVTGIHWWGMFGGWTESHLPPDLPVAFHIGIWTDGTRDSDVFDHPGSLIWETYSTNWVWAASGNEESDSKSEPGETCFLFSQLLSQDQWFQIDQARDGSGSTVYWLSIAALYDSERDEPEHVWTWKLRATASGAAGTSAQTILPAANGLSWPPTLGAQWKTGREIYDSWFNPLDMAFQLTTYVPLELDARASARADADAVGFGQLVTLAAEWLNTVR